MKSALANNICADYIPPDLKKPAMKNSKKSDQPNGLDAPYYRLPEGLTDLMDMIEWLEGGGMPSGMMNILKSIVREYNPDAQKETSSLYEAEKRFFFAERHLRRVQALQE